MKSDYIIFDLDDTLASELHYLQSAFRHSAARIDYCSKEGLYENMMRWYHQKDNVFAKIIERYPQEQLDFLLSEYRDHMPSMALHDGAEELLHTLKSRQCKLGLISDGRSTTQRNKLKALGIENMFDQIIISGEFGSEKPDERNFRAFMSPDISTYFYVADNPKKDFITPNRLGWTTVCLLNAGHNIHPQNFTGSDQYLPAHKINHLSELIPLMDSLSSL